MKLEDIINNAYSADWVLSDEFLIEIDLKAGVVSQDIWNMSVVSFSSPELSAPEKEAVIGGVRKLTSQLQDLFRFNIVFRDVGQVDLRRYFEKKFALQQKLYPSQIETTISIYHIRGSLESEQDKTLVFSTSALITNISGATWNNAESNIQEFTVSFSSGSFNSEDLWGFGTNEFDNDIIDILASDLNNNLSSF